MYAELASLVDEQDVALVWSDEWMWKRGIFLSEVLNAINKEYNDEAYAKLYTDSFEIRDTLEETM